jgi:hypothetical protein
MPMTESESESESKLSGTNRSLVVPTVQTTKLSGTNRSSVVQIEAQWYKSKLSGTNRRPMRKRICSTYCTVISLTVVSKKDVVGLWVYGTMGLRDYGPGSISLLTTPKIQASYCRKCVP